ncbi:related to ELAV-like protein 2 [Ustilago trichophora]|uniref:Related to ELAV-like protein 2 n=1 Tax=Ustilago trichophora TaxID=86804 RepID=A0A5C3E1D1_9BASI|nr:related to ELAV-like protein 2 [Ustilago trichophora]
MIPRSDRVFFHTTGSPPFRAKNPPPPPPPSTINKSDSTPGLQSPIAASTTARWNGGKRINIAKDPRNKMRVLAPATPWRPRISRKSPTSISLEDQPEEPSPLDRKLPASIVPLKLGAKPEAGVLSSAPTSATLAPAGGDKDELVEGKEGSVADACRREPVLEQQMEEWLSDRWGSLRSDHKAGVYDRLQCHPQTTVRPEQSINSRSALGLGDIPYSPTGRRQEACLALDMNNDTNIYVNGLPKEMTDHMLYLLGSACGVVISHKAMMDRQTGLCKGFGFLMYATSDMAKSAIEWLNSHGFTSSFAKESFSARLRRMADNSSTNVYLSNLPLKFTVHQLEQLFNPHPIASLKMLYDAHGESRGVGFVRLHDRATAKQCIERLHGRVLPGTTLPLQVRFADSEAQKHLKHTVHQKHTLESLGLLGKLDDAIHRYYQELDGGRVRSASEVDAVLERGVRGVQTPNASPAFAHSFIPAATSMPVPQIHGASGLGIEVPNRILWPHAQTGHPTVNPAVWPSVAATRVVYSGMEGSYPLDRGYPLSPVVATDMWDGHKASTATTTYLPISFIPPPPGLTHTAPSYAEHTHSTPPSSHHSHNTTHIRQARKNLPSAAVRVRFPAATAPSDLGRRAVSDPLAMLAAQARVKEALGMSDRVRSAVSADNSVIEAEARDESRSSAGEEGAVEEEGGEEEEEEEDSMSIDIQVNARAV